MRFWQQLANAGLINGTYDGIGGGTVAWHATRTNSPASKYNNALWAVMTGAFNNQTFDGTYTNSLILGGIHTPYGNDSPIFIGEDLYNIDVKVDDGKPATGKLVILFPYNATPSGCADTSSLSNLAANYLLSSKTVSCAAIFRNEF